jgi:transcription initiation factor TFIID subunit TAF12
MDSLRRSPPEMPPVVSLPMRVSATLRRPTARMTSSARASFCARGTARSRRSSAVMATVSRTVSVSRHTVVCATKPEARLKEGASSGAPFT